MLLLFRSHGPSELVATPAVVFVVRSAGRPLLTVKDPDEVSVYAFDWDREELPDAVTIADSEFLISGPDADLTSDNERILSGSRSTTLRLTGGTNGKKYTVTNRISTDETPAQTLDFSVKVRMGRT